VLRGVDANRTVLDYLREDLRRTGTKEGCAEGDCGACTVVLGELDGDGPGAGVRFRAVNSCIKLLPTLDGKALFTVESLRGVDGSLHPVQQAMVDCHGSQCGFCTPGFVMSLFALYKSERAPSRRRVEDALAGNLCRCTGYRPILDAARKMYQLAPPEAGWLARPCPADDTEPSAEEAALAARLRSLRRHGTLEIHGRSALGSPRAYWAPRSLDDLAALVAAHPDARLLAGGTDVGLWITKQHRDLEAVIYTGEVAELKRLAVVEGHLEIGAAVTVTDALDLIAEHHPDLGEVYRRFGSPPIRNAATLGGNVANGSPIGDSMPGLIALGASVVLRRGDGSRELPLDELYLGYRETAMQPGELIERLRVPVADPGRRFATYKVSKRFDQDISAVCAAFALRFDGDPTGGERNTGERNTGERNTGGRNTGGRNTGQRVAEARICFGGMAATPRRAAQCEASLLGRRWDENAVAAGMEALDRDYEPISDMRASAAYRRLVARNLLRRFFLETSFLETSSFEGGTRVVEYGR